MRNAFIACMTAAAVCWTPAAYAEAHLGKANCPYSPVVASFRVLGAPNEFDGVAAEYKWLYATLPEWERTDQAHIHVGNRDYDLLFIKSGRKRAVVCFDITDFFGKSGN